MNRQQKRLLQRQGQIDAEGTPTAGERRRPAASQRPKPDESRPGLGTRTLRYGREVRNELVKVAWPNRSEVANYTVVVLVTLVLITTLVFALNYAFAKGVLNLFGS